MGLDEFDRIDRFFKPLAEDCPDALGLSDDAAILRVAGVAGVVVSTDAIVEGVHFNPGDAPDLIARKALRTNLSDLAAMGAEPWAYTLTLALGPLAGSTPDAWVAQFAAGLAADQDSFGIRLIGGDSVSTPGPLTVSITIFGKQVGGESLRRNGAAPGDDVYVSGTIGDAALGLAVLQGRIDGLPGHDAAHLVERYRLPRPRTRLGLALLGHANAAMDVSDGLAQDLGHLCAASGVSARLAWDDVPLSGAARILVDGGHAGVEDILGGGDDYELLFTAPPSHREMIIERAASTETQVTRIGVTADGAGVTVVDAEGRVVPLRRLGYRHA